MPSLSTMLQTQSLPGFAGVENPPTLPSLPPEEEGLGMNPYLRCPLPPFSTTSDTLRQWNFTGKTPVMRVIPLPTQQGAGGGASTNVTNVTETGSAASGGTSPTPTALLPLTAVFNFPALSPQQTFTGVVKLQESFQLIQLRATQPVEVRTYSTALGQIIDITRLTDAPIPFSTIEGLITDVVLDVTPLLWEWQNRIGANGDDPQSTSVYITVVNPSATTGVVGGTVLILYLPLET